MNYQEAANHQPVSRMNCDAYQDAMLELMKEDQRVVHIDCDLLGCINGQRIKKVWPDRVINAGIAEANAMGVACGLSATGIIPYLHTFGVFAGRRMFDQAFLSSGYSHLPVHVIVRLRVLQTLLQIGYLHIDDGQFDFEQQLRH